MCIRDRWYDQSGIISGIKYIGCNNNQWCWSVSYTHLTPKQCEQIHICLLKDIERECEQAAADIFVCYTPEDKEKKIRKIFGKEAKYFPQRGEDLGVRMYVAIEDVLKMGYDLSLIHI